MSAGKIMAELPRLTVAELRSVEQRIVELTSFRAIGGGCLSDADKGLRAGRIAGRYGSALTSFAVAANPLATRQRLP